MEKVCINCKHIVPHVHEFINDVWEYNAKCAKGKRSANGKLFTIPDRNTYSCEDFAPLSSINCEKYEEKANVFPKCDDI